MITKINYTKTLTKHISCECKCKLVCTKMQFKPKVQ